MEERRNRRRNKKSKQVLAFKIYAFVAVLGFLGFVALIIPLRPKESEIEKRALTKFPKPTLETLWNGEFFEGVNTWYADTFPFRETLIAGNMEVRAAYGKQTNQLYGDVQAVADASEEEPKEKEEKKKVTVKAGQKQREVTEIQEKFGAVYVAENTAFGLYGFNEEGAKQYTNALNTLADKVEDMEIKPVSASETGETTEAVSGETDESADSGKKEDTDSKKESVEDSKKDTKKDSKKDTKKDSEKDVEENDGKVHIYDMIVPISSGVYLDADLQKELGSSDQLEAIQYMCDNLDERITPVDVFATLEDHNDEYLYFRTDHHWTALGAYYAYKEFMEVKGWEPTPIEEFETMTFDNFLGTMYSYCNQSPELAAKPDTITAYIPKATNKMTYTDKNGKQVDYDIITDVSSWKSASRYNCFIGGDQPLSEIHNPEKTDGSACLVVKESFGNAFVPFLVDHYEYVYVVDYRYYPSGLPSLIEEKNIQDVLFLNNISAASSGKLVSNIEEIVNL